MVDRTLSQDSTISDTSGFVEHLRLIHFTLCVTCLIGVIAIASQTVSSASRAYDQTNILLRLSDKWQQGRWFDEFFSRRKMSKAVVQLEIEGSPPQSLRFSPFKEKGTEYTRFDWLVPAADGEDKDGYISLPSRREDFETIRDAEKIWNTLHRFRYAVEVSAVGGGWAIAPDGHVTEMKSHNDLLSPIVKNSDLRGTESMLVFPSDILRISILNPFVRAMQDLVKTTRVSCYLYAPQPSFDEGKLFRAECKNEKIDLQALLGTSILPAAFPPGDFQHSFPDASELAKNLKTLALNELQSFFKSEKDRAGDKIELPGVKLPAESLAYWGTAIIFAVTLYWFSVFRDFRLRLSGTDKAWATPWIGISREATSKALFLVTTLFPPITAAYLIFCGVDRAMPTSLRVAWTLVAFLAVGMPIYGIIYSWRCIQLVKRDGQTDAKVPVDMMQAG
jgi:hypothetical protein